MLAAGAAGGAVALLGCLLGWWLAAGAAGAFSAAVAGVVAIGFFAVGQAVQALVADLEPAVVLLVALVSYLGRVVALGALLWLALGDPGRFGLLPVPLVLSASVVVAGWLGAELWAFSRLRIPVYDEPAD